MDAKMFAVQPLPSTLHVLATRYETEEQNFAYALSLACFLATQCHPYAHVAPFEPWRVTELVVIAQLLSQTAPLSATGELAKTCPNAVLVDRLSKMDQVSMCEAILRLVAYYGPMAHSDDWEVTAIAKELLDDIEKLQGRERESASIRAWLTNPERQDARAFVEEVVLMPINELAGFAVEILVNDMADDNGLVLQSMSQS
jgi:SET and MYND domain-containing protein